MGPRGGHLLVYRKNLYVVNRTDKEKVSWLCSNYTKSTCRARCTTVGDRLFEDKHAHNHADHSAKIKHLRRLNQIL